MQKWLGKKKRFCSYVNFFYPHTCFRCPPNNVLEFKRAGAHLVHTTQYDVLPSDSMLYFLLAELDQSHKNGICYVYE